DAEFFLSQDQRISLQDHAARLKDLRFVEGLGSMYDKAERVGALFTQAPAGLSIESGRTLALLAKADLVTEMVGEFPELQGVIGAYYAKVQGETTDQALAIEEHYAPKGPADSIPSSPLGCALALMDKLDTIAGFAAKDALPKGSGDPFGIRRAMLGVIRIMVANDWLGHLLPLLHRALAAFGVSNDSKQYHKLIEFYRGRMVQHLRDQGIDHGVALAAMDGEIAQTVNVARALYDFISTDAGQSLKTTYVRAQGILRQVGAPSGAVTALNVARENLNVADCALWDTAQSVGQRLEDDLTATARLALLGELSAPLDDFFELVLINTEDIAIKGARLDILRTVVNCVKRVANFDRLISG
ncbi:MAG: glycine--tRNA ligase subunit beta, partial [Alphaproteobacteria bacterium]|nr:glycine--tRNA ligase subunit beta [Alphaproteobacteria bacterium]